MEKMPIQTPEKKFEFPDHEPCPQPPPCAGPGCCKEQAQRRAQLFVNGI